MIAEVDVPTEAMGSVGQGTDGRLVYAIGDVHGRADLFAALVATVEADADARPATDGSRPMLVLLGDLIDRGPASAQVLERVLALSVDERFELRCVLGNHEEAMLDFLDRRTGGPGWLKHGGGPTMASYGVAPPSPAADRARWAIARDALRAAVPDTHRRLLDTMELTVAIGDYLFVHAGVRPGVALADQDQRDLLWIRSDFLEAEHGFGQTIVHGHTPTERPVVRRGRIGLDTGAYVSGVLTAARLDGGSPLFIQARGSGAAIRTLVLQDVTGNPVNTSGVRTR